MGAVLWWSKNREYLEGIRNYMAAQHGQNYIYGQFDVQRPDEIQSPIEHEAIRLLNETPATRRYFLSDALERYLAEHKRGQDPRFARDARRAIDIVTSTIGDLPLADYTRDHARAIRDVLSIGHSTATIRRRLGSISAIFNLGRREFDIQCQNPFEKLAIAQEGLDVTKRLPFTQDELQKISAACLSVDDDIRWIVAIQLATGARLAEIVGLRREDVLLDHEVHHIWIRPHLPLGRSLKTPGSERLVPLPGIGLWGAERAMATAGSSGWLFPRYARTTTSGLPTPATQSISGSERPWASLGQHIRHATAWKTFSGIRVSPKRWRRLCSVMELGLSPIAMVKASPFSGWKRLWLKPLRQKLAILAEAAWPKENSLIRFVARGETPGHFCNKDISIFA
jgi:integrase